MKNAIAKTFEIEGSRHATMTVHRRSRCLALLLGICLTAGLGAQPADTFIDTVEVNVVEVDVVVTDRKGHPVSGLTPEDFELFVDGAPVEIANFYESSIYGERARHRGPEVNSAVAPDDVPAATASEGAPVMIAIYLDDLNTHPAHRTRLLSGLAEAVGPWRDSNARFMLATFVNRLEILVPPTTDLDKVLDGAASRSRSPARAVQNAQARTSTMQNLIDIKPRDESGFTAEAADLCEDRWDLMLTTARIHAEEAQTRGAVAVDGLAALVGTLGGLPGKKAVIYVSDGLAHRPGVSVFTYLVEQLCPADEKRHSEAYGEMMQYNEASRFNRLAGEIRQISVELARHAAKGRRIEYRRSYRDKSVDERLAERLLSVAYLGNAENPLRARVGFAASEALKKNVHELAVGVDVPAEAILALPLRGEETGQLRLWLLAVREDDGARTTVRQKSLLVSGGSGVAAIDGAYRFEVAMKLPEGEYQVAVGVRDETTGVTSLLREPVSVPTSAASPN